MYTLFHHLLTNTAKKHADKTAIKHKSQQISYSVLANYCWQFARRFIQLGLQADDRVTVYLPKQIETVVSFFAASMSGGIFVPVNPLLKATQVKHIVDDCQAKFLITSLHRYQQLQPLLEKKKHHLQVILVDGEQQNLPPDCLSWSQLLQAEVNQQQAVEEKIAERISKDIAAILYTSGSTGNPKGVVLSHNNLIAGAKSVACYLKNNSKDRILALLPFSFDYGLSQLTTAFLSGASLVLVEYLLPNDLPKIIAKEKITALAAIPPLWMQLSKLDWSKPATENIRYITNSGGAMPTSTLQKLQQIFSNSQVFLMYGLTEAFRSTYLDPAELNSRPTSIGKAIPDAEILLINQAGKQCQPGEEGELVHRGPHVALGYWNAAEKTRERFKPLPNILCKGLTAEIAVWSGDTAIQDEQGFFYFIGRKDDMIKSSGYRISPTEIENAIAGFSHVDFPQIEQVAAIGVPHFSLGEAIILILQVSDKNGFNQAELLNYCQKQLPGFMQPKSIQIKTKLPTNANGKIDRALLRKEFNQFFTLDKINNND